MGIKLMKKGFALFITMVLLFIFASVSLSIIEVQRMDKNIDKFKYYHLQSRLHLEYVKEYILKHQKIPIWDANIEKYNLEVFVSDDNKIFDIFISPIEDITVRVHQKIIIN
jgi:hypothetical protein